MATPSCEEIDAIFRLSEQVVSRKLIKKRTNVENAYWGRVKDDGQFPLHSGTSIKGIRLGRIHVDNQHGWYSVQQGTYSTTRMCEQKVPEVIQHGFDEYFYSPMERQIRTDWICIKELAVRDMPADEINHLENGLQDAARYVWDETYRSRYSYFCDNKIIGLVPDSFIGEAGTCDESPKTCNANIVEDAFIFETRVNDDGSAGEIDERYIRVRVNPTKIGNISELSLDMLDIAAETLEYDSENFFGAEAGIGMLDVVLAHKKMGTRMAEVENLDMDHAMSRGFQVAKLVRKLGTKLVFRDNYSVRYDLHAMRFYPDDAFNATLAAYDENSPATWPRFKRVFAYVPVAANVAGVKYVTNPYYRVAPFGISVIYTPRVMMSQAFPDTDGVGMAQKAGTRLGYAGSVKWKNPDWPCNEDREMGYYKMRFGVAIKPWMTEEGWSFFHRIDHRIRLVPNCCDLPTTPCDEDVLAYSYAGMGGSEQDVIQNENRPVVYHGGWY